jgi:hypothetical protein
LPYSFRTSSSLWFSHIVYEQCTKFSLKMYLIGKYAKAKMHTMVNETCLLWVLRKTKWAWTIQWLLTHSCTWIVLWLLFLFWLFVCLLCIHSLVHALIKVY